MKININKIISLIIVLITISYTGIFAGYHGSMTLVYLLISLFIFAVMTRKIHFNKIVSNLSLWIILFIYLCLNSMLNIPSSFLYVVLLSCGLLVLFRRLNEIEIESLIRFYKVISIVLAVSILVQAYIPNVFYDFARKWFYYSTQYNIVYNLGAISHQYSGLFYEVSFSGFVLSIGCAICFVELILKKQEKIKNCIFSTLLYYAVILTGKRSFMLILPILLISFWIITNLDKVSIIKLVTFIGFVVVLIWKLDTIFALIERVLTKGQGGIIELSSREKFWKLAIDMFKESPIIGQGINSFDIAFNKSGIRTVVYDFAGAHNSYIQILAETGIVGTFMYIFSIFFVVFYAIKDMLSCYRRNNNNKMMYYCIAILCLFIIIIYGMSGNVLHQPQQVITLFLFMSIIVNLKKADDSNFNNKRTKRFKFVLN